MKTIFVERTMARKIGAALAGAATLMTAGMLMEGTATAVGIADTKHNLSSPAGSGATATFTPTTGTGELCVFCHTPHGSDTSAVVPLWNRALAAPTTYTTYNSLGTTSLDGATAPVGSVSLACLSCHDGTTAMNVMINQPGSGGYNSAGAAWAGAWAGTGQTAGVLGTATSITRIGQDLRNDHPIGIQYGGGMPAGGAYTAADIAAGALKDADFKALKYASLNGQPVWWVDSGTVSGTRDKADMMLYTRTGSASVNPDGSAGAVLTGAQAFVECASCHDPHTSAQPTFLRMSNAGSALCLACHTK
ncbi:MAG: cytochrome c3 family protein [Sulfuricella sp.]|nr:cytochrome c3 family protein [Gammaproteobacteria bacterium]